MADSDSDNLEKRRTDLANAMTRAAEHSSADGLAGRSALSSSGAIDEQVVAFNVFSKLMASDGIRAALYSVLRRSNYRFISIFRFKDGNATSVVHVDREDLSVHRAAEVADTATYCCYVRDTKGAFVTADAMNDARTAAHPAREAVRSYCGLPILAADGGLIGTLCHYDLEPRDPAQLDLDLLVAVCAAVAASGQIPAYPAVESRP